MCRAPLPRVFQATVVSKRALGHASEQWTRKACTPLLGHAQTLRELLRWLKQSQVAPPGTRLAKARGMTTQAAMREAIVRSQLLALP